MNSRMNLAALLLIIRHSICLSILSDTSNTDNIRPPWEFMNDTSTTINVSMKISQIRTAIVDVDMTFELYQTWHDPRFVDFSRQKEDFILFNDASLNTLWRPDTYIANEMPNGLFETTPTDHVKAFPNGSMFQNTRHSIIFHCNVKLFAVPFKDEICSLKFQSSSYSNDILHLQWQTERAVTFSQDFRTFAVKVTHTELTSCTEQIKRSSVPCLDLKLHLQRIHRVMIIQVYLPTSCILFITWLGFWIHHTEVSGRTRIYVTSFTVIIAEGIALLIINPDQIHMEAVQAWNAGCIILITASFLEFVIVHNIHQKREAEKIDKACGKSADIEDGRQDSDRTSNTGNSAPHPKDIKWMNRHTARVSAELIEVVPADTASVGRKKHNKLKPEIIDRIASFVFVILFLAFNIFYWTYFVTSHDG